MKGTKKMSSVQLAAPGSRVAVLGASPKEDRYSFKAVRMLKEHGYRPIPVHPAGLAVARISAVKTLDKISEPIDTLTIYVNSKNSETETERILMLNPRRVVFNPGTENEPLAVRLETAGILVVRACTLVLLQTRQF